MGRETMNSFSSEKTEKKNWGDDHQHELQRGRAEVEEEAWPKQKKREGSGSGRVTLEGYVGPTDGRWDRGERAAVGRSRSLRDEDLEELKGCLDLGFGFSYEEIPDLCGTLPALELCYSMSQLGPTPPDSSSSADAAAPLANWNFSSPGDDPEEVKARLKYWAQAVACTVKLCS